MADLDGRGVDRGEDKEGREASHTPCRTAYSYRGRPSEREGKRERREGSVKSRLSSTNTLLRSSSSLFLFYSLALSLALCVSLCIFSISLLHS